MLSGPKEIARPAELEIEFRQFESVGRPGKRFQAPAGVVRVLLIRFIDQDATISRM